MCSVRNLKLCNFVEYKKNASTENNIAYNYGYRAITAFINKCAPRQDGFTNIWKYIHADQQP